MKQIRKFVEMYNATSVESPEGSNRLETYQAWLERQLQRRIEIIEELKAERKQPPKTAEEILANKGFIVTCHEEDKTGVRTMLIDPIIEAMEEYANQFRSQGAPTGDEIEAEMDRRGIKSAWDRMNGRTMARWAIKQMKP